jgi:transcriptional regulator with XRE-family HTH domain
MHAYNGSVPNDKDKIRTENFLRLLQEEYGGSPTEFFRRTGYSASMVSQIKTGKKFVGEDRAAKLEDLMGLERGTLERRTDGAPVKPAVPQQHWPLSVPLHVFKSLSPRRQRELDEAFTRMVLGAQSQELLERQAKPKR